MDLGVVLLVGAGCAAVAAAATLFVCRSGEKVRRLESEKNYEAELARLNAELAGARADYVKLEQTHQKAMGELKLEQEQQMQVMVAQMKIETETILKQRSSELSEGNKSDMDNILKPLRESIVAMQKAMKDNEETHIRKAQDLYNKLDRAVLDMAQKTADIGAKADSLSEALTSKPKVQGCFGENLLDDMLANEHLEKGVHYSKEAANDDRSRPDFVFHFKEGLQQKDLVVDSKVSLTAFVDYVNADDEKAREIALANHLKSVRNHIDELYRKEYAKKIKNPFADYVVMFMPVAAALQLAMDADPTLWRYAYSKGVLITTEQTIIPFLKIIQLTWNKFHQDTNQLKITKAAETMIERVASFYDSYRELGGKLRTVCDVYNKGIIRLKEDGHSITTSARQVMSIGIRRKDGKDFVIPDEMLSTEKLPSEESGNDKVTDNDLF